MINLLLVNLMAVGVSANVLSVELDGTDDIAGDLLAGNLFFILMLIVTAPTVEQTLYDLPTGYVVPLAMAIVMCILAIMSLMKGDLEG